jgi:uncharacterized protein YkwD
VASRAGLAAVALGGLALAACAVPPPSGTDAPRPGADPVATVNAARTRGCGERSARAVPLRADTRLAAVAARLPRGEQLAAAVEAERYPAARSASIHVTRAASAEVLYQLLTARFCADVADPAFQSIGVAGRGDDIWIVLAAPFSAPAVADAGVVERRVLALVNEARAKPRRCGGQLHAAARPLALDATLGVAALAHARDMARHGRMAHEGSDGSTAAERVTRAGYAWRFVAENVAAGDTTADAVMKTWLESPGHCANLMSPDARDMGVAYAFDPGSPKGTYWAQVFAARR